MAQSYENHMEEPARQCSIRERAAQLTQEFPLEGHTYLVDDDGTVHLKSTL
eukprot:CAMPEP_0170484716 /NCGR_PEP_ID=MMETSP0208-20121228/4116_1 /TAXON_ID=197538 /ORGANISM="Strombidium inclinatum, Strain S3" /LENGTH=50 /DNA_ID=CAMNT_0010758115 /DNA_START=746 /DNA_END=894 /DNA_ORIENTATION=-